jgi:hypothetical protein
MRSQVSLLLFALGLSSLAYAADPAPSASGLSPRLEYAKKKGPSAMSAASVAHPLASGSAAGKPGLRLRRQTAVGELATAYQKGELKREEIAKRYDDLRQSRATRRMARVNELEKEHGPDALVRPEVAAGLAKHHRRISMLDRARLVAESELEGTRRAAALARIEGMRAKEHERHDAWLEGLKNARAAAPSASPAPSSVPPKMRAQ